VAKLRDSLSARLMSDVDFFIPVVHRVLFTASITLYSGVVMIEGGQLGT
jgi:hypothetical protein